MPHTEELCRRFFKRMESYEQNAVVQKHMAQQLAQGLMSLELKNQLRVLEIGCGGGFLTREICARLAVSELILNELFNPALMLQKHLKKPYQLIQGNAEEISWPPHLDLIASNAVFQWFLQPEVIFIKAWEALNPGGLLAFTTFLPGHFSEFKTASGLGLEYPTLNHWESWMTAGGWTPLVWKSQSQIMEFDHPLRVLDHIRKTGVGGVCDYQWTRSKLEVFTKNYPRVKDKCPMTYHYHFFVIQKPLDFKP